MEYRNGTLICNELILTNMFLSVIPERNTEKKMGASDFCKTKHKCAKDIKWQLGVWRVM